MIKNPVILYKTLIIGVIFLFVGPGIVQSISGYNNKSNIQLLKENPSNFPLNDGLLAYWKFDECSGNIAHDSSGHGYDGTIYGATWVPSGSGCALYFDGVDDYVDLDTHAENHLGFNRTDDLIFSFYFKSTSTDLGLIYSISNNPGYGYKPGVHIALYPNGTLEFEVWFEGICGITLYSVNSYNDGTWHYVKILYNGIIYPLNQTITIFVDGELDNSIQDEMCKFYADQFHVAKIGRKSYEPINYFEGTIDEFKIIKYPDGNKQESPVISGPINGDPGVTYNYSFVTNDPENDNISLEIDWDDGNVEEYDGPYMSGEEVTLSHSWVENGTYNIKARSKDIWDYSDWSDPYEVTIGNRPPSAPMITGPKDGKVNIEYDFTFTSIDPQSQQVSYYIIWGDGATTGWSTPQASGTPFIASHTWTEYGTYVIKAKAKNTDGLESGESTYLFPVPRNRATNINLSVLKIVEQHSNLFQMLRYILGV